MVYICIGDLVVNIPESDWTTKTSFTLMRLCALRLFEQITNSYTNSISIKTLISKFIQIDANENVADWRMIYRSSISVQKSEWFRCEADEKSFSAYKLHGCISQPSAFKHLWLKFQRLTSSSNIYEYSSRVGKGNLVLKDAAFCRTNEHSNRLFFHGI